MTVSRVASAGCWLLLALLPAAGCGNAAVAHDPIPGAEVGTMAERELEARNPRMATGTMTCPELPLRIGASVRCVRTVQLSGGRVVTVGGTVEVTSLSSGGRLHVAMDDRAEGFGLAGEEVAVELSRQYARRTREQPGKVECPYLRGSVGATATCRLRLGGRWRRVEVVVTDVDPPRYRIEFRYRARPGRTS
jgi:hypothetical protein